MPVRNLISEIVGTFEKKARSKNLLLEAYVDENAPEYINSDAVRVRQVLANIIGNAVKFTSEGMIQITVKPHVPQQDAEAVGVEVRVTDTGPGLTEEQAERLFSPFTQADTSVTRKFGGTGLGLALSRRLARELGGDVKIAECHASEGCEFVVTFSSSIGTPEKETPRARPKSHVPSDDVDRLQGLKVLVAEDSQDNQLFMERLLKRFGIEPKFADNGEQAITKALNDDFDVVLMDIQMPQIDGHTATRELRTSGYTKPIVALTAHALIEEKKRAFASGCDAYLTKPVSKQMLLDTLVRLSSP